jgi:arylsulfatase A-like enzyme
MNVSNALLNTDLGLSNIVSALQSNNLLNSTYIVLTSKHGQGPVDTNRFALLSPTAVSNTVALAGAPVAMQTADTSSLLWLADQSKAALAVGALVVSNTQLSLGIQDVWSGEKLKLLYGDPATDQRVPDVIAWGKAGAIYTTKTSTFAEHGGNSDQETIVPIVISNPNLAPQTFKNPVTIMQVAPTILQLLNLNPFLLQAVQLEHTPVLPGFDAAQLALNPIAPSLGYNGVSIVHLTNGQAQFQVAAAQQKNFAVQASTDLTNWTSIATNTLFLGATTNVTDTQASNYTQRYYRAVSIP